MSDKRIIFSTSTPNDQGGIIPNEVIDFARYKANPVILKGHRWEEEPLGLMTDIKFEGGKWSGVPVFHKITEDSRLYAEMYDKGFLRGSSIGGAATWKTNPGGQTFYDKNGLRLCTNFDLYEISMVSIPSNPDATTIQENDVTLAAKIYQDDNVGAIADKIVTLSSQYNKNQMDPKETEKPAEQKADGVAEEKPATLAAEKPAEDGKPAENVELSASAKKLGAMEDLPGILKTVVTFMGEVKSLFTTDTLKDAGKADIPKNEGSDKPKTVAAEKATEAKLDDSIKLGAKAEKAKVKAVQAAEKAEKLVNEAKAAKEAAEKEGATEEHKAAYKAKHEEAEKAIQEAEAMEMKAKAKAEADDDDMDEDDMDEEGAKAKEKPEKSTNNSPKMKTIEQLKAENTQLAPKPEHQAKVIAGNGVPFSKLSADPAGEQILNRVMSKDAGQKDIADYAVVLNSILADGRLAALQSKVRFMQNVNEAALPSYQSNPNSRSGLSLTDLAAKLNRGEVSVMLKNNTFAEMTNLSATSDFLASPDLLAIEFLPLAIFKLFPTTSWKKDIPLFGATETGKNTGLIFANIAADPTITKGTKPVSPTDYTYSDTAVALTLVPYWLQPMLWEPLTMHQLRYDQMTTGWAQAFAKFGAVMDDDMIYTLASTVPASSIVMSSGAPFNITGADDPNSFYYNPAFTGNLLKPAYNDIQRVEQIYNKQNFELAAEKPTLVIDPTMDAFIGQDPDTKSLLTRWVKSGQDDLLKIKNTVLPQRSRVAIYDPATGQVKDPSGVIPTTSVSAAIGFIPSNVGIGLGMLDVFMIQDPSAYGYKMSADIRIGIVPLRKNYNGTTLYTYGPGNV